MRTLASFAWRHSDRLRADQKSEKGVASRGHQKAGTAGFTAHTVIDAARLTVDEIAGIQRSVINFQDAVEKMQFFSARMPVRGIIGSRIKPDQHAHAVNFRVPRKYFDVDTWRRFFPVWFTRHFQGRHEWLCGRFGSDSFREPTPQRFRWAQHIGGPADKRPDNGPQRLDFLPAFLA